MWVKLVRFYQGWHPDAFYHSSPLRTLVVGLGLGICLLISACETSSPVSPPTQTVINTPVLTKTSSPTATITSTPTPTATSAIALEAQDLEGVNVTLWHPWSGEAGDAVQAAIEAFNQQNPYGIRAGSQYLGTYNDLYGQIDTTNNNRGLPSLTVGYDYTILQWLNDQKGVVDLTDYVEDPTWGLSGAEKADFFPGVLDQGVIEGMRIGFPAERLTRLLIYNRSWAEELGFDSLPQNPQEFQQQACAAALANKLNSESGMDRTGGWLIDTSHATIFPWLVAFGAEIITPDGKGYQFNTPATEEAFTFLKELYDAECAWEDQAIDPKDAFAQRKALFITLPLIELPQLEDTMLNTKSQDNWSVTAFPAEKSEPLIDLYGPFFTLFAESQQERLAAWLLIKWLTAPEQQASFIEARGSYPTRNSVLQHLSEYGKDHPQWLQSTEFLSNFVSEPQMISWDDVRWLLEDVGSQLFRYYYMVDRIPLTLELMDETAKELNQLEHD